MLINNYTNFVFSPYSTDQPLCMQNHIQTVSLTHQKSYIMSQNPMENPFRVNIPEEVWTNSVYSGHYILPATPKGSTHTWLGPIISIGQYLWYWYQYFVCSFSLKKIKNLLSWKIAMYLKYLNWLCTMQGTARDISLNSGYNWYIRRVCPCFSF